MRNKYFILIVSFMFLTACANNDAKQTLKNIPQDVMQFVPKATANQLLISNTEQKTQTQAFLQHYFSPWTGVAQINSIAAIKADEMQFINQYTQAPGYAENYQPYAKTFIQNLQKNMNLGNLLAQSQAAILIDNTDLRVLPTNSPSYSSLTEAGQWYPFDNWQESFVHVNTPIAVIAVSQDAQWDLIITHNDFGWVNAEMVANVDKQFIKDWQTSHFIIITKDHTSFFDRDQHYEFEADLGAIFPLIKTTTTGYEIAIAVKNIHANAKILTALINQKDAVELPLPATAYNIAKLANQLLGNPYGWGGLYGYRDCSATMADLFTPFGIWLPRNSGAQVHTGQFISFANLSLQQKEHLINTSAIPFLTLIGLPGHITLYLGRHNGQGYVFQDVWGLHTRNILFKEGRAVIGQTIVTPLNFGNDYINVPQTFIDKANGMTILSGKNQ